MKAKLLKTGLLMGNANLYELDPPLKTGKDEYTQHVVVSAVYVLGVPETYVFASDKDGEVTNWIELDGSFKGGLDHNRALEGAGYSVDPA